MNFVFHIHLLMERSSQAKVMLLLYGCERLEEQQTEQGNGAQETRTTVSMTRVDKGKTEQRLCDISKAKNKYEYILMQKLPVTDSG